MGELSCQKVIGEACFKAYPEFARRAIAYRLLHLLIPPNIAKILPKQLSDPLIAPGVTIPLDAKFPPGTCIIPGCSFPAGWDPDEDPPECAKSAPLPTLAMQASGGNPPTYLTPGPGGPLPVQPQTPVPPEVCIDDPAMAWDYGESAETIDREVSVAVAITGLNAPFTWEVSGTGFSLENAETDGIENTLHADATACGSATITVTGCDDQEAIGYVRCSVGQWIFVDHSCPIPGGGSQAGLSITKILDNKKVVQTIALKWWHKYGTVDCADKCGLCTYDCTECLDWDCHTWNPAYVKCGDWECIQISCDASNYGYCICVSGLDYYEWTC